MSIDVYELLKILATVGGCWLAIRVEIRWIWSEVKRAHKRIDHHAKYFRIVE